MVYSKALYGLLQGPLWFTPRPSMVYSKALYGSLQGPLWSLWTSLLQGPSPAGFHASYSQAAAGTIPTNTAS